MKTKTMEASIEAILAPGKGILAADESFPTIEKRFKELGIDNTEDNRRSYRELLFTTPGLADNISGVILFDETIRQNTSKGMNMAALLVEQGIVPGIKVDGGTAALPGFPGEKFTLGLDGLKERLAEYAALGAKFTKWRAVISIGEGLPTHGAVRANAAQHALYAALSQEAGLVPIVEPEILMEGDHTIARCEEVATGVLRRVFEELGEHRVSLEHMLLKTGMILSGDECQVQAPAAEVAAATLRCFSRTVPSAVPGIVFLSGGQPDVPATQRLNEIAKMGPSPWKITFSYGRALQDPAMKAWSGQGKNVAAAHAALQLRAKCNGLAVKAAYTDASEKS
ncbi:MAG TPA: class I fructose-bisphosphate aldolase [Opitutaceae bacterium]|jgi:fructose-bisphosphate aldolase class I|nr:class I fructose-bisphosphate aldolase [Opitutaceae bacterium]